MHADTVFIGGTIVTMDPVRCVIEDGGIAVRDGQIVAIDTADTLRDSVQAAQVIDCTGHAALLIDGHFGVPCDAAGVDRRACPCRARADQVDGDAWR